MLMLKGIMFGKIHSAGEEKGDYPVTALYDATYRQHLLNAYCL